MIQTEAEEEEEAAGRDRGDLLYLWRGDFDVDDDGCEGGFGELRGVVDGVRVQNHQLQGFGEFEYPLDLTLDLRCTETTYV